MNLIVKAHARMASYQLHSVCHSWILFNFWLLVPKKGFFRSTSTSISFVIYRVNEAIVSKHIVKTTSGNFWLRCRSVRLFHLLAIWLSLHDITTEFLLNCISNTIQTKYCTQFTDANPMWAWPKYWPSSFAKPHKITLQNNSMCLDVSLCSH